ncbi:MAG: helix-turn-helix domain-containing protein [Terriglobales bacterium]
MPQLQLPMFPAGVTHITNELAFECRDGTVTYFTGQMPVFRHGADDQRTFRMIISQFVVNGNARQAEIARAFGITLVNVKRAVRRYREQGPAGFYAPRRGRRGPAVLTPAVIEMLQAQLDAGIAPGQAARELGLKPDTVARAVRAGQLQKKKGQWRLVTASLRL